MRISTLAAILFLFVTAKAFAQGIQFETGDWKSVLDKAVREKKLIYVDVYTSWCGPCKMLAAQVFPQPEAGDKYNRHFVNYRIDAEKGEGVALAQRYAVNRYPTHLFIDPATQKLVYRSSGATASVSEFNHHADLALQELGDPLSLDKYAAKYKAGERSERFLRAYLEKAGRLSQPEEAVLGSYVDAIASRPAADSTIAFVLGQVSVLDAKAVPFLMANAQYFASRPEGPGLVDYFGRWSYGSFEQAVRERDPARLDTMLKRIHRYTRNADAAMDYWYRTQFYARTGDLQASLKAGMAEAEYLTAKPLSYYQEEDAKAAAQARQSIRVQLKRMNADSAKLEELVEMNIKQQPAMLHSSSFFTATNLNNIAWQVYEQQRQDPAMLNKALSWSRRAMDLTAGTSGWTGNANTNAHLLYAVGRKDEAVKMLEAAVARAAEADAASLKASLEAMQAGKL